MKHTAMKHMARRSSLHACERLRYAVLKGHPISLGCKTISSRTFAIWAFWPAQALHVVNDCVARVRLLQHCTDGVEVSRLLGFQRYM